jgi:ATPase subunit of ABC transporter with duplicated ATPase domains
MNKALGLSDAINGVHWLEAFLKEYAGALLMTSHDREFLNRLITKIAEIEKVALPRRRSVVKFIFRDPPRSGDQVAVLENLHKAYGRRVVHQGMSLTIRRGERWAVMGRNGAGKTTLLKMIAGMLPPDSAVSAPVLRWVILLSSRSTCWIRITPSWSSSRTTSPWRGWARSETSLARSSSPATTWTRR